MGVVSADSENSSSRVPTMRRRVIIWTQRHRRPLTVVLYVSLLSVLSVLVFVPSYLDALLAPLFGGSTVAVDGDVEQPVNAVAPPPPPPAVVRKLFDLPFVPQRDFLCDEMHLKVSMSIYVTPFHCVSSFHFSCVSCRLRTFVECNYVFQ